MNMRCIGTACFCCSLGLCPAAQMDVTIEPGKATYVAGEPVFVTVKIANSGVTPLTIMVPNPDSCLSAIHVAIKELHRSDRSPCADRGDSSCSYDGPAPQSVEIKPNSSYEMRRLLNLMYDLGQPGKYHAHVHVRLEYADAPLAVTGEFSERDYESDLTDEVVAGDAGALEAAFSPVLADLDSHDFKRQWYAQKVLLTLAPRFAESRILAWVDRVDLGQEVMPALRKLGTEVAIEKLESVAFEAPDGNEQREPLRQAALEQIKYIDDKSLLPKLLAITAQNRGQMLRWNAASAAARIGHAEAVPAIGRMLADPDPVIALAGAEALGDTASADAVGVLISAIPAAAEGNTFPAIIDALARLTHRTETDFGDRMAAYRKWNTWWTVHHSDADIYGPDTCVTVTPVK